MIMSTANHKSGRYLHFFRHVISCTVEIRNEWKLIWLYTLDLLVI